MDQFQANLDGIRVMIAIPGGRPPDWITVMSLIATLDKLRALGVNVTPAIIKGSAIVTKARDQLVDMFLESDCTHMFWIDDDMNWRAEDFVRVLALATHVDVVGVAYTARRDPPMFYIKAAPDQSTFVTSELGLLEIEGMGLGFTCMNRKVVEDVARDKPTMFDQTAEKSLKSVFRCDIYQGNFRGEDMAFFADIREKGYKVWMDPSIELGHFGQKEYRATLQQVITRVDKE